MFFLCVFLVGQCLWPTVKGEEISFSLIAHQNNPVLPLGENGTLAPLMHAYKENVQSALSNMRYKIAISVGRPPQTFLVTLGDAKIGQSLKLKRRVTFGAAKRTYRTDSPIIGFGITKDRTTGTLIYEQAYKEKLFDRPIFTLYLKNCKNRRPRCMHGGTLTLGAYDKKNCGKVEGWAPSFTYGGPWQFKLSKISVGDYTFRTPTTTASDSGSPMLHLPARVVRRIARELDATYQHNYYMIRCSKRFVVKLTINGKIYKIQKDAITFNMGNGRCLLYISEGDDNFILLGDPFQRAYCHIHDFKNRRIGFALPKKE